MPSDRLLKAVNAAHRLATRLPGGVAWRGKGMQVVELTTTGRRSGQPRTVMLTSPIYERDRFVLVGSRGGDDVHPAWVLNIGDHPDVEVRTQEGRRAMRARVASGEERAELWPQVLRRYPHYGGYQERTDREIPLVIVEAAAR